MTIQESTICSLVQSFPILLILAQNHNRCLKTPLIYKPPSPTPSPEYYEALDALFHSLYGHGYHGHDPGNGYSGCSYGHGTYIYGKKYSHYEHGHSTPCYTYSYPSTGHGYSTGTYGSHVPSTTYHGYSGYPNYVFKKVSMYNASSNGYKGTYAPTQVYNMNHKYKVVVKRNKTKVRRRKPQKLRQGFNQRDHRRFPQPQFGFAQNFLSNTHDQLTSVLHVRPHSRPNMFIYPFNNRPITNDPYYYDQYGRPMYPTQNPHFPQNYPERPYEPYQQPGPVWGNNFGNEFNGVHFPQDYKPQETTVPPTADNQNAGPGQDVNFPTEKPIQPDGPIIKPTKEPDQTETTNLPFLTPVPTDPSESIFTSPPITIPKLPYLENVAINDKPGFPPFNPGVPEIPATSELPPFLPNADTTSEPSPFKPQPAPPDSEFPGFKPKESAAPGSDSKPALPTLKPELPPLTPVAETSQEPSPFKPIPQWKPELPAVSNSNTQSPFKPADGSSYSENKPSVPDFIALVPNGSSSELPPLTPVPELPRLTPVPESVSRDNFNFGPAGLFSEPCELEGRRGSCVPLTSCEPYVKMLQQAKSNPAVGQFLRKAHCGFEGNSPKVCCPTPGIPDQPPPSPSPSTTTTTTTTPEPETKAPILDESGDYVSEFPQPPTCGSSNATLSRVVGGIPAKLGDFPWMALLGYKRARGGTGWLCGGTLVSSKHVLTAAHCIHGQEQKLYVVRLGELDLAREDEGATPVDILVKKMMKHEEYSANSYVNDIGVLMLEREVQFTDLIRPICIPRLPELRANTFENYNPIIAGWGALEFRGPSATILQVLQLPVTGNDFCQNAYKAYAANVIDDRVICAGYKKGGKDACQGDSGGPLMQPIWNSQELTTYFYQIGVVSYGKKCAEPGFPGVYSRVTTFVPWLEEKILGRVES